MGANTTTINGNVIEIVPHATWDADWYIDNDLVGWEAGIRINSIVFKAGSANDVCIILNSQDGTVTDPEIVNWKVGGDTEEQVFYGRGQTYWPCIDASNCVGDADCRILIHFL